MGAMGIRGVMAVRIICHLVDPRSRFLHFPASQNNCGQNLVTVWHFSVAIAPAEKNETKTTT